MHAFVLEVTNTVDYVAHSISILASGHQEIHNCITRRFSSTEFMESTELVIVRVQFLALYWKIPFYMNIFLFHFKHSSFKMPDFQNS